MRKPIVTLTTDFGLKDHFVGVLKGVIAGICPEAGVIDISHDIQPFEISEGAYVLSQAYRYFPPKTVHVAVVDPGVGSARRPILVEAAGQTFIGPDNGLLALVYSDVAHKAREITNEKYFLKPVSQTFHGRDIFAPVAAHIAKGVRASTVGKRIEDHLKPMFLKPQRTGKRAWQGTVLHIDRFGNLITNFHMDEFAMIRTQRFVLAVGIRSLTELGQTYSGSPAGEAFVLVGSSGFLEVAVNQGSAAKLLGCGTGAPCELTIY